MEFTPIDKSDALSNFVRLPIEAQYKFLRRSFNPPTTFYGKDTDAKDLYLNPNNLLRVSLNVGVYNDNKETLTIHLVEFSEGANKIRLYAIDDRGLQLLGGSNPDDGGGLEPAK
jgi:hypothetical protein